MKVIWTLILLVLSLTYDAEALTIDKLAERWQAFRKSGDVQNLKSAEVSETLRLVIGDSFYKNDANRQVRVLSSKLEKNKLIVTLLFPQIVIDISQALDQKETDYLLVSRQLDLDLDSELNYELEVYGVSGLLSSEGKELSRQTEKLFLKQKLLASSEWLKYLRNEHQVADASTADLKAFLNKKLPEFKVENLNFEAISAKLKKDFKQKGFDLIIMSGEEDPDNILTYSFSYENVTYLELVQRLTHLKGLKYRLGREEVIIASDKAFKKSKTFKTKDGLDLPGLKVDVKNAQLILDAKVCLSSGILEYLMCLPNSFEHESVFMTKVKPELIHMGLLLVKAEQMPYKGRSEIMKRLTGNQSRLKITVRWQNNGETKEVDLNKLLVDRSQKDKTSLAEDLWFFAGSYFTENNIYAANIHKSVISLQQHHASVIHYGKETLDPYKSKRGGFEVNSKLCPPMNSQVKLVFTVYP